MQFEEGCDVCSLLPEENYDDPLWCLEIQTESSLIEKDYKGVVFHATSGFASELVTCRISKRDMSGS